MPEPELNRRDWFRLRSPHAEQSTQGDEGIARTPLAPVEAPPNHDGMDLSQLPPMREAFLGAEQVAELFRDIAALGSDIQLMQRGPTARRAEGQTLSEPQQLDLAKQALLSSTVQRVQIRYRWQESLWIDTLSLRDGKYHLIRIAHQGQGYPG